MNPCPHPVIYLDFDGVLHPDDAYVDVKGRVYLKGSGSLFMWAPILEESLAPYPDVKIVLSTSWVRVKSYAYARNKLPKTLRQRVIGATWHSALKSDPELVAWWQELGRCRQISLDADRRKPTAWAALDDDHDDWVPGWREKLVATHPYDGLGSTHAQQRLSQVLTELDVAHRAHPRSQTATDSESVIRAVNPIKP